MKDFKFFRGNRLGDGLVRINFIDYDGYHRVRVVKFDTLTDHYSIFAGLDMNRLFNIFNSVTPIVEYITCGGIKFTLDDVDELEMITFENENIEVKVSNNFT